MKQIKNNCFSEKISVFQGKALPESDGSLAGYAALINAYDLKVPLPEMLSFISIKHVRYQTEEWQIYTLRHKPEDTLQGHLKFALKYEGVDLGILNALFKKISPKEIEAWVKEEPVGQYSRRIWFFFEWLRDQKLNLADADTGNYIEAINPLQQYEISQGMSHRHRVINNLPGKKNFCPLVRRTEKIEKFKILHLSELAHQQTGMIHKDVLTRAAAFLLLKDSRASFAIEGESHLKNRVERWGRAISQAGIRPINLEELLRLQRIVIEDTRFVKLGLREDGGFIGVHERGTGMPLPDHISAHPKDLPLLLEGMTEAYNDLHKKEDIDPVILAAVIAFGFVFIHPFVDGNGRIQRYLVHHVLADLDFAPKGIVFPISAVILERIDEYRCVLESYSKPRLEFINWRPTKEGNVEILNETIDLYRYFDATRMVEFLYDCVSETIEKVLPKEIRYLECYDRMKKEIEKFFDMPDYLTDLLIHFLEQNNGKLSKRAKEREFKSLSEEECAHLENLYGEIFKD